MRKDHDQPEIITLLHDDLQGIKARILANTLEEHDKKIILTIINSYQWLQDKIQHTKINIFRLRKLFGFKTEKRTQPRSTTNITQDDHDPANNSTELTQQLEPQEKNIDNPPKK